MITIVELFLIETHPIVLTFSLKNLTFGSNFSITVLLKYQISHFYDHSQRFSKIFNSYVELQKLKIIKRTFVFD
jgi:hypothetical protein